MVLKFKFSFQKAPITACCDEDGNIEVYIRHVHTMSELIDTLYHEAIHGILYKIEPKLSNRQHHDIIKALEDW